MTIAVKGQMRPSQVDKGEWLSKLLEDVQTAAVYAPAPIAVLRMRTRIAEGMLEPAKKAA
jgi:hypothetical protein